MKYCPKCGCPIGNTQHKTIIDENTRVTAKKDLFTGLLLNIFSIVIPLVLFMFLLVGNDGTSLIQDITFSRRNNFHRSRYIFKWS